MLKSPWIPFLSSIPIEAACIPLLLFVPAAKYGQQDLILEDDNADKASPWLERVSNGSKVAYNFIKDNIMVFILLLPWIPAFFSRHPFALIYAAKKFDTTFADVRTQASCPCPRTDCLNSIGNFSRHHPKHNILCPHDLRPSLRQQHPLKTLQTPCSQARPPCDSGQHSLPDFRCSDHWSSLKSWRLHDRSDCTRSGKSLHYSTTLRRDTSGSDRESRNAVHIDWTHTESGYDGSGACIGCIV